MTLAVVQLHKLAAQLEASCKGRLTRHRKLPLVSGSPVFECQMLSIEPLWQLKYIRIALDLADYHTEQEIISRDVL